MPTASRRRAPNSACHACRRLKMRCVRISSSSCERCARVGRTCIAIGVSETPSDAGGQSPAPAQNGDDITITDRASNATSTRPNSTISALPSIYSTSPVANHQSDGQNLLLLGLEPHCRDESVYTAEEAAEWLQIFREKLLFSATILEPADFADSEMLFVESPNLVTCIVYVISRYVPGSANLRFSLKKCILEFLQSSVARVCPNLEKQVADLQALIILYIFGRSGAIERITDHSSSSVDFWMIKTTCEAYALRMNLQRSAEAVHAHLRAGNTINRSHSFVKLYLYWLWMFSTSHHVAIVTGTPPTIMADASIRAAPSLLESLKSDPAVITTVAEAELCLVWYTLGAKDSRIKEWWCPPTIQELATSASATLTQQDIDAALADCKHMSWLNDNTTLDPVAVLSTSPAYYFHYTRFCLNTFFLPRATGGTSRERNIETVKRCVDSALSVLNLSNKIGPIGRDQLRYFPGFLFVMLSYCSSFVLKAIQAYPGTVPNAAVALDTVRKVADFMVDLGLERGHSGDAFTAGQSVLRQISSIQQETQTHPHLQQPSSACSLFENGQAHDEQQWLQDIFDQQFLGSGYNFQGWDGHFHFR